MAKKDKETVEEQELTPNENEHVEETETAVHEELDPVEELKQQLAEQ